MQEPKTPPAVHSFSLRETQPRHWLWQVWVWWAGTGSVSSHSEVYLRLIFLYRTKFLMQLDKKIGHELSVMFKVFDNKVFF